MVRVEHLSKTYLQGTLTIRALDDVSFSVDRGEFVCVAGPSGSGKTTLLNMMGLLDRPTEGRVYLEDREVGGMSPKELSSLRRKHCGFIFQNFHLFSYLNAFQNVEFPLIVQRVPPRDRRARVQEMLKAVLMEDRARNMPFQLSGGQMQRVAIARALVTMPRVVLADEPTANLDSKTAQEIIELMRTLNRSRGITFVFSTHDRRIMNVATKTIFLQDGAISGETAG